MARRERASPRSSSTAQGSCALAEAAILEPCRLPEGQSGQAERLALQSRSAITHHCAVRATLIKSLSFRYYYNA